MDEILPGQAPGNGEREYRLQQRTAVKLTRETNDKERRDHPADQRPPRLAVPFLRLLPNLFECHH